MRRLLPIIFLSMFFCVLLEVDAIAQWKLMPTTDQHVYKTADLPKGGQFVKHPTQQKVKYYSVSKWQIPADKKKAQKSPGIYLSIDGGVTWKTFCDRFDFKMFFIHPKTAVFYAIITDEFAATDEKGFLQQYSRNRVLMSVDGKKWKSILTQSSIGSIFADPDHRNRICVCLTVMRPYILQSNDDNYSKWKWYRGDFQWNERKRYKWQKWLSSKDGDNKSVNHNTQWFAHKP